MEITGRVTKLTEEAKRIKEDINNIIRSLPDNPDIQRLSNSPNCFIVQLSTVQADRHHNLSPVYYDFKYQYRKLINKVNQLEILTIDKALNDIISEGQFKVYTGQNMHGQKCHETIKLHPEVIKRLKELI